MNRPLEGGWGQSAPPACAVVNRAQMLWGAAILGLSLLSCAGPSPSEWGPGEVTRIQYEDWGPGLWTVIDVGQDGAVCMRDYFWGVDDKHWRIWTFQLSPNEYDKLITPLRKQPLGPSPPVRRGRDTHVRVRIARGPRARRWLGWRITHAGMGLVQGRLKMLLRAADQRPGSVLRVRRRSDGDRMRPNLGGPVSECIPPEWDDELVVAPDSMRAAYREW